MVLIGPRVQIYCLHPLCVWPQVSFKVDYAVGNREYGTIRLQEGADSVNLQVLPRPHLLSTALTRILWMH